MDSPQLKDRGGSRDPLLSSPEAEEHRFAGDNGSLSRDSSVDIFQDSDSIRDLKPRPKKERWSSRLEYILSLIGLAVGFGNIWRFSYYVQLNGGGAFLIPYFLMLVLLGIPAFYLEVHIGKIAQVGPLKALYRLAPPFGGAGLAAIITLIYIVFYYNLLIAYVLFYLFSSFQNPPAWSNAYCGNLSLVNKTLEQVACNETSATLFYYLSVAGVSSNIEDASGFSWKLMLCILGSWLLVFLCTFKGIKSFGKIAYVTTLLPYVVLTILLVRGATFEGAGKGLEALFSPNLNLLLNFNVWLQAGSQIFFSLSLGTGSNIVLASHLDQKTTVLGDIIFVAIVNSATSLFAGIVVFMILGHNAFIKGVEVESIVAGPGLVFIAFATALLDIPPSPLWSVLFFLMMLSLGLGSQFASIQSLSEAALSIPYVSKLHETIISFLICLIFSCCSVIFVLGNGEYIFTLLDEFAASYSFFVVIFFELIGIAWYFGVKKLIWYQTGEIIVTSTKKKFSRIRNNPKFRQFTYLFWFISWAILAPLIMIIIFSSSLILQFVERPDYTAYQNYTEVSVKYPDWSLALITLIIFTTILPVPVVMLYENKDMLRMLKVFGYNCKKSFLKLISKAGLTHSTHTFGDDLMHYSVSKQNVYLIKDEKQI